MVIELQGLCILAANSCFHAWTVQLSAQQQALYLSCRSCGACQECEALLIHNLETKVRLIHNVQDEQLSKCSVIAGSDGWLLLLLQPMK